MNHHEVVHILVVDDEKIIRDGSQRILTKEGWKVETAENGEVGLELIKMGDFQIILLDLMMPGIRGMEVLKKIREEYPKLIVIVITGYATIDNAVEAMKNGAYDFISKPFTPDQLRIVVRRAEDKLKLEHEAELLRRERERSLKDIAYEKTRTFTIINQMADGVLVTDKHGTIVLHNPAATRLFGLGKDPPLGKHIFDWTKSNELTQIVEGVLSMEGANPPQGMTRELSWGSPPNVFFVAHAAPVRNEDGEVLGSVTIFNDVTWFKKLDQMKSDFVEMVSHELRSPLSSIRQSTSLITDRLVGEINEKQQEILSRILDRLDGLLLMINNLLDLSRIEAGGLIQQTEKIFLPEIIQSAVELMTPEAGKKKLHFEVTCDPQLCTIHADRQGMETIFTNLLTNAVKYNQEDGKVIINAQNRGEFVEIKVTDTGVGISKVDLPNIFDKFFRIRTEYTRKVVGSGLGLPLVKAIIEAHLGTITVESEFEKGTTFTILLPRGIS
ncbi:MAG: response regulator [Thermodesulfobacteriota bacterium]|jgi:PAS domain S-box-containing protein|nr:MAG: response regulator [Thermodesulfobacteriota bacterium]